MKSEFSSPAKKQESSPEGKLGLNYNTQMINNQNHSRHPELDSRHSVLDTESKTPKLRFKEFSEEWEEKRFGDIYSFYSTNSFSRDNLSYGQGNVRNIHYGDIHTKFSTLFRLENENVPFINNEINLSKIKEENYCVVGDLVIADASEDYNDIGKSIEIINLNNEKTLAGLHTFLARPNKHNMALGFVCSLLKSWNVRKQIMTIAQGTKVLSLSSGRLAEIKLNIPSKLEQQRIASFLSAIDTKIDQLTRKKELLEQYKKGVIQKIFSQELRFKADDGSEFPEWEEKKLGNYLIHKSTKNKNNEVSLVLSVSNKKGFISQEEQFDGYEVASSDITTYKIANKGDYAYNPSRINVGSIARLDKFEIGVVSPMYVVFALKKDLHPLFFDNLYQTYRFKHLIKKACSGSVRDSLNFNDLADFDILLPIYDEQTKIANFLSTIDTEITLRQAQGERLKQFKKALLSQMFV